MIKALAFSVLVLSVHAGAQPIRAEAFKVKRFQVVQPLTGSVVAKDPNSSFECTIHSQDFLPAGTQLVTPYWVDVLIDEQTTALKFELFNSSAWGEFKRLQDARLPRTKPEPVQVSCIRPTHEKWGYFNRLWNGLPTIQEELLRGFAEASAPYLQEVALDRN